MALLQTAFPELDVELLGLVLASKLSSVEESIKFLSMPEQRSPAATSTTTQVSSSGKQQQQQQRPTVVQTAEATGSDEPYKELAPPPDLNHREKGHDADMLISCGRDALWKSQLHASWREELDKMPAERRQKLLSQVPELESNTGQLAEDATTAAAAAAVVPEGRRSLRKKLSSAIVNLRRSRDGTSDAIEMFQIDEDDVGSAKSPGSKDESGILQYERDNNPLLAALRHKSELRDLVQFAEEIKVR